MAAEASDAESWTEHEIAAFHQGALRQTAEGPSLRTAKQLRVPVTTCAQDT